MRCFLGEKGESEINRILLFFNKEMSGRFLLRFVAACLLYQMGNIDCENRKHHHAQCR